MFGNNNYVFAVGNPADDFMKEPDRYKRAQQKSSGLGMVTFNTLNGTIRMDAFRFLANKDKPTPYDQFPGWPHTIKVADNDGRKATAYLPQLQINKPGQLVKIIDESTGELVSVMRANDRAYTARVLKVGTYTIVVGEGDATKKLTGIDTNSVGKPISVNV